MGKHDDGRRYLNHSYHVPVGASKSPDRLDVDREQDCESSPVVAPTLINTPRQMWKRTLDKQNIAEASSAIGVTLPLRNFLEDWKVDK